MNKQYKAVSPEETIENINRILDTVGIPVIEETLGDGDMFCSCRIAITEDDDLSIGTNGKGMNQVFARASGYAEMMERFQNRVIVYPNPASFGAPCRFYPDEKPYEYFQEEAIEQIRRFVPRVLPPNGINIARMRGVSLPFYHVNNRSVENVPYSLVRWINGSNGMCAGNIPEEALIQGFNEIFERYCIQEMYVRQIVPPDVPKNIFEGTEILHRLERIKDEYGMTYFIKDYSLGEGFPVIGLMIYSEDRQKYIMHLGADLDPKIALERCFTEIFQGYTAQSFKFENDVNSCEKLNLFNEFKRSLMYGRGRLPKSYFVEKPSYQYTGCTIPIGKNFQEDLNNICQWVINKGYNIFIRNNSFLGFPTFQILVPGMSEIDSSFCNLNRRLKHMELTENELNPLFNLRFLSMEKVNLTIDYLESIENFSIDLFTHNRNKNNHVNRNLVLMLLYLSLNKIENAENKLSQYIRETNSDLKIRKAVTAFETLKKCPHQAMKAIATPICFNCGECQISDGCRFPFIKKIEDITQEAMAHYHFNQFSIGHLFSNKNEAEN